jgi:hypothetical protein
MVTTMVVDDDNNKVDGNDATGSKVNDDGNDATGDNNDNNDGGDNDDGNGDSAMGSGATG